ncbi:MAG TPA: alkaline phosphatase family protein [Acidobacteriota bacterium]|nr:alkaline phosphatase family protein [Acidobacteriota bacterium]
MGGVFLIGVDGATFSVLNRLMAAGVMPCMAQLVSRSVRADLISTPNPFTPPAWTTMTTGRTPGNHGVFDFVRILKTNGRPSYAMATSMDVKTDTIWEIASRAGYRVAALNFPMMFPPRPVNGFVVPGFVPWKYLKKHVYPTSLYDRLATLPGFAPDQLLFDWDLEREALQVLPKEKYEQWLRFHIDRERLWASVLLWLMREEPCDLTGIVFDGVDKLQHLCWRFLDPDSRQSAASEFEDRVRELCLDYFRQLDANIGEILEAAGADAWIIVASDHGFGPTSEIFYANVLLHQHGYLEWAGNAEQDQLGRQANEGHRSPLVYFDWARTTACALTPGSNGIYFTPRPGFGTAASPNSEYRTFRDEVAEVFLSFRHPDDGGQVVTQVLTAEEAFPGRYMDRAPDLTLVLRDRGFLSVLNSDCVVRSRKEIAGTHNPLGIFLAAGPGISQARVIDPLHIQDVASILLHALGLDVPDEFEGSVPEAFRGFATQSGPKSGYAVATAKLGRLSNTEVDEDTEAEMIARLKALGYLE